MKRNLSISLKKTEKILVRLLVFLIFLKKAEIVPYIDMANYMRAKINFGGSDFDFPQTGFNTLHLKLNKTQLAKLESRFQHYNKIVIEAGYEDENLIHDEGVDQLQKDLAIDSDTDIGFFILAYKLDCHEAWQISLEEWMNGFLSLGCDGMTKIKESIPKWRKELEDQKNYKDFFFWLFPYFKGNTVKSIPFEEIKLLWDILIKPHKLPNGSTWKLYNEWIEFCTETKIPSVTENVWQLLWVFHSKYTDKEKLEKYKDDETCFPTIFDDFVDWLDGIYEEDSDDDL